jgi:Predicted AAA-ATPase
MDGESDKVSVILRPRRFGKSTNLSMLRSFFSFGAESHDFSKFLIGQEPEFMDEHCGKYPVVMMNMKGIGGNSWEQMLDDLWVMLRRVMRSQAAYLDDEDANIIGFAILRQSLTKPLPRDFYWTSHVSYTKNVRKK